MLIVITFLVVLACVLTSFYFHYQAHIARNLLLDLQSLSVGTPAVDIPRLMVRYKGKALQPQTLTGPCTTQACTYAFGVQTFIDPVKHEQLSRLNEFLNRDEFGYFGIRLWQVSGEIHTGTDGRIESIWADIYVEGACHKDLSASWRLGDDVVSRQYRPDTMPYESNNMLVRWNSFLWGFQGEGLTTYVTPSASSEEREAAFGTNTHCLDRLGQGCFLLIDIFPGAVKWQQRHGWPLGFTDQTCHGINDPR